MTKRVRDKIKRPRIYDSKLMFLTEFGDRKNSREVLKDSHARRYWTYDVGMQRIVLCFETSDLRIQSTGEWRKQKGRNSQRSTTSKEVGHHTVRIGAHDDRGGTQF